MRVFSLGLGIDTSSSSCTPKSSIDFAQQLHDRLDSYLRSLSRDLEIAKVRLSDDSLIYSLDTTDLQLLDKEEQHVGDHDHYMSEMEDQGAKLNEEVRYYCQFDGLFTFVYDRINRQAHRITSKELGIFRLEVLIGLFDGRAASETTRRLPQITVQRQKYRRRLGEAQARNQARNG